MGREIQTYTLGCKVNFADTQQIAETVNFGSDEPVEIIGTCCVTAEGEKQSRKEARRASRRVGSKGKVFVTGCAARLKPVSFDDIGDNIVVITGNPQEAARIISASATPAKGFKQATKAPSRARQRTRYFLKVQDGCGRRCSYCIIPAVRGGPFSLPIEKILRDAGARVEAGYRELVVTGINAGAYRDGDVDIAGLMERLANLDGLERLRLSSIEALHINENLLQVIANNRTIGRHLHIPLQSGDDGVLKSMRRSYDLNCFLQKIRMAREAVPGINLTTDVIVGFPTEDSKSFENTMRIVDEIGFTKVHVFTYSPRPDTEAASMGDMVPQTEKKRRSRLLRSLSDKLGSEHRQRKVGHPEEILLESSIGDNRFTGYSSDSTRYVVEGGSENTLVNARGVRVTSNGIEGEVILIEPGKPGKRIVEMTASKGFREMR